jgi:hypothetical protein
MAEDIESVMNKLLCSIRENFVRRGVKANLVLYFHSKFDNSCTRAITRVGAEHPAIWEPPFDGYYDGHHDGCFVTVQFFDIILNR